MQMPGGLSEKSTLIDISTWRALEQKDFTRGQDLIADMHGQTLHPFICLLRNLNVCRELFLLWLCLLYLLSSVEGREVGMMDCTFGQL